MSSEASKGWTMFYILKLCYAWLLPPGLFILALLTVCWRCRKTVRLSKLLPVIMLVYLLSLSAVSDRLIRPLEEYYLQPALSDLKEAQVIAVLGGGSCGGVPDFNGEGQIFAGAANRYFMGLRLHRELKLPVILSGGPVFPGSGVEASISARLLKACGVEEKHLLIDSQSRNTVENARFTKQLCEKNGFKKVILVTSAYHMPRSVLLFRREGVDVIPYPADYQTNRNLMLDVFAFTPSHRNVSTVARAVKEYLGILAVKAGLQLELFRVSRACNLLGVIYVSVESNLTQDILVNGYVCTNNLGYYDEDGFAKYRSYAAEQQGLLFQSGKIH